MKQEGYLYCISNEYMPGILKIGKTTRDPETRLREANSCKTWAIPVFQIEFAKKVQDVDGKEKTLHKLLEHYTERIYNRREFFRVSLEEVKVFFDLIDGEMWISPKDQQIAEESIHHDEREEDDSKCADDNDNDNDNDNDDDDDDDDEQQQHGCLSKIAKHSKPSRVIGCRVMAKCFTHRQLIRHTIGITHTWIGRYDSIKNKIIMENGNVEYNSLNQMVIAHYKQERPNRVSAKANAWDECECQLDNERWISTFSLPEITAEVSM
ncbi:MAG: GIY-YIG nuclease family protein [Bacteroidetes bacterium]|nr:GIY-YIG nuclease family protein [Bacteroidota bacterium]